MKPLHTIFSLIFLLTGLLLQAQPQLTWRMNNPRHVDIATDQYLEFQVEVMSNTAAKYFNSMTIEISRAGSGLSSNPGDLIVLPGSRYNFLNSAGNQAYVVSKSVAGNLYQIGLSGDPATAGNAAGAADFTEIDTAWDVWATIRIFILDQNAVAGLAYNGSGFATGTYRDAGGTVNQNFLTPHWLDTKDLRELYLGRIFSSANGYTQFGGTVTWEVSVNTSVWDSGATITDSIAYAAKLRIHPASPVAGAGQSASLQGGQLRILPGNALVVSDSTIIEQARGLVIGADSSGTAQFLDNGIIRYNLTGSAQADVYLEQDMWHFYSPAVFINSYLQFFMRYMKYYNELDASNANGVEPPYHSFKYIWIVNWQDTIILPPMTGYAMWSASTGPYISEPLVSPTGILNTGNMSRTITRSPWAIQSPPFDGWNLIGNPYPSAIDISSPAVTWGNTEISAWFWDPGAGNYEVWLTGGTGSRPSPYVAPQQAFFVHHSVIDSDPTTFSLTNAARVIQPEPFLKVLENEILRIRVSTEMNTYRDKAVIRFAEGASGEYEEGMDAFKMFGNADAPQIYMTSDNGKDITVNALPLLTGDIEVPLKFSTGTEGEYTLDFTGAGFFNRYLYLEDKLTGAWFNLDEGGYTFTHIPVNDADRFVIHFKDSPVGVSGQDKISARIYSNRQNIYLSNPANLKGTFELYDISGRSVLNVSILPGSQTFKPGVSQGYYSYRLITGEGTVSGKLFLQ